MLQDSSTSINCGHVLVWPTTAHTTRTHDLLGTLHTGIVCMCAHGSESCVCTVQESSCHKNDNSIFPGAETWSPQLPARRSCSRQKRSSSVHAAPHPDRLQRAIACTWSFTGPKPSRRLLRHGGNPEAKPVAEDRLAGGGGCALLRLVSVDASFRPFFPCFSFLLSPPLPSPSSSQDLVQHPRTPPGESVGARYRVWGLLGSSRPPGVHVRPACGFSSH
ncbi:hypothetical protein J3F83DRAFT_739133 [Trichoderma novae-zelandiae]